MTVVAETRIRNLETSLTILRHEYGQQVRKLNHKVKKLESRDSILPIRRSYVENLAIILPCLFGCLYQAFQITDVYLKYDVTAESLFYPGDVIIAPMVTFCIKDNFKTNCSKTDCQLTSTQFFNAIYPFENITYVVGLWLPSKNYIGGYGLSMADYSHHFVTTYIINGRICYAINFARYLPRNYTFMDTRLNPTSVALHFRVKAEVCSDSTKCNVYVTSVGNYNIKSHTGKPLISDTLVQLNYQKQELNLLPPPYTTKCFDYSKLGIHSQDDCIAKSLRLQARNTNESLQSFVPVMRNENVGISPEQFGTSNWNSTKCTRSPCRLEQFYVSDSSVMGKFKNDALVTLMFPENGELIVNYKPKVTLWEFLTLFGSVFSLWLGCSGLGFVKLFANAVGRVKLFFSA